MGLAEKLKFVGGGLKKLVTDPTTFMEPGGEPSRTFEPDVKSEEKPELFKRNDVPFKNTVQAREFYKAIQGPITDNKIQLLKNAQKAGYGEYVGPGVIETISRKATEWGLPAPKEAIQAIEAGIRSGVKAYQKKPWELASEFEKVQSRSSLAEELNPKAGLVGTVAGLSSPIGVVGKVGSLSQKAIQKSARPVFQRAARGVVETGMIEGLSAADRMATVQDPQTAADEIYNNMAMGVGMQAAVEALSPVGKLVGKGIRKGVASAMGISQETAEEFARNPSGVKALLSQKLRREFIPAWVQRTNQKITDWVDFQHEQIGKILAKVKDPITMGPAMDTLRKSLNELDRLNFFNSQSEASVRLRNIYERMAKYESSNAAHSWLVKNEKSALAKIDELEARLKATPKGKLKGGGEYDVSTGNVGDELRAQIKSRKDQLAKIKAEAKGGAPITAQELNEVKRLAQKEAFAQVKANDFVQTPTSDHLGNIATTLQSQLETLAPSIKPYNEALKEAIDIQKDLGIKSVYGLDGGLTEKHAESILGTLPNERKGAMANKAQKFDALVGTDIYKTSQVYKAGMDLDPKDVFNASRTGRSLFGMGLGGAIGGMTGDSESAATGAVTGAILGTPIAGRAMIRATTMGDKAIKPAYRGLYMTLRKQNEKKDVNPDVIGDK